MRCASCEREVDEVCQDGFCRRCHVSLSFEDCCDGTWAARISMLNGRSVEEARKIYPDARI
ncbi:unnamed protein product [marine sediment metagenome]|uniref:Uncharacterized protein n=1 Tax=marine sediment metagenome TaxID=412755 RepID=X0UI93_9ZZZZ